MQPARAFLPARHLAPPAAAAVPASFIQGTSRADQVSSCGGANGLSCAGAHPGPLTEGPVPLSVPQSDTALCSCVPQIAHGTATLQTLLNACGGMAVVVAAAFIVGAIAAAQLIRRRTLTALALASTSWTLGALGALLIAVGLYIVVRDGEGVCAEGRRLPHPLGRRLKASRPLRELRRMPLGPAA